MNPNRIHAVHLLNDFSGSPLVFSIVLSDLVNEGASIFLYTSTPSRKGFLSGIKSVEVRSVFYKWSSNRYLTLFYYLTAQFLLFFKLLFHAKKNDLVYVNTLLPFGALLAGKAIGCKVRLHIHEVSIKPPLLKKWLVYCAELCASEILFVSKYVASQYQFKRPLTKVELNKLPSNFFDQMVISSDRKSTVLMLCSLKAYKGVYEFLEIAKKLPEIKFELVLNASEDEVLTWTKTITVPQNCAINFSVSNTHLFFSRAKIVMNLSRPDEWIETFGMTILEAMAYKAFVIVPTVGGPLELVQNYPSSRAIDSKNTDEIVELIRNVFSIENS